MVPYDVLVVEHSVSAHPVLFQVEHGLDVEVMAVHDHKHVLIGEPNHGSDVVSVVDISTEVVALRHLDGRYVDYHVGSGAMEELGRVGDTLVELSHIASVVL